jgi:hypothetical protein
MNRLILNNIAFIYYPQAPAGSYYLLLVIGSFLAKLNIKPIQYLIAVSPFTLSMSENLELCPKCKQGHLKDTGDSAVKVEIKPPLKQPGSSVRERICDHCGHRQIDQYLNEYAEPVSDKLSGTTTKASPEEKTEE